MYVNCVIILRGRGTNLNQKGTLEENWCGKNIQVKGALLRASL